MRHVGTEKLIAYSDACGGQHWTLLMTVFWLEVLAETELISIDHIFMVSAHSFLPCDGYFGVDERAK